MTQPPRPVAHAFRLELTVMLEADRLDLELSVEQYRR